MESATAEQALQAVQANTNEQMVRSTANEPSPAGLSSAVVSAGEPLKSQTEVSKDASGENVVENGSDAQQQPEAEVTAAGISPSSSPLGASANQRASGFPRSDYVPPLPGTGMDATNVFIKYLPTDLTNTGLFTLFSQFGEITSCKVMVDPITGYSLGYGFVRFSTAEEAANAISNMYGTTIGNKTLLCKLSHGIPQNNATPSDNLYIKPLLDTTTEEDLLALFSPYGRVLECKVMLDKNTGQSRQIGFVRFATIEEATKALAANNGRYLTEEAPPMVVKYAESRTQKIARRAKLLANQAAAESRRNAAQQKYHHQQQHQQQSDMMIATAAGAELAGDMMGGHSAEMLEEDMLDDLDEEEAIAMAHALRENNGGAGGQVSPRQHRNHHSNGIAHLPHNYSSHHHQHHHHRSNRHNHNHQQQHRGENVEEGQDSASAEPPASIPYIVKDEYGNVTFAPDLEQVENAAAAAAANQQQQQQQHGSYWHGSSAHYNPHHQQHPSGSHSSEYSHHNSSHRGGSRRGGRGGSPNPRGPRYGGANHYHHDHTESPESNSPTPAAGGVQYRKKGSASPQPPQQASATGSASHAAGNASYNGTGSYHSNYSGSRGERTHHHSHNSHNHGSSAGQFPTFRDASTTPRVQLAGKVEVSAEGELVAPEWADDPKRLFISHLPAEYDDGNLQALFESFGTVDSAKISQDKRSVRPKTYGFVQFASAASAAKAVKELHGTIVAGRSINVAFDATQSVAKHKSEMQQQQYYMQQHHQHMPYYPMNGGPGNGAYNPTSGKPGRGGRGGQGGRGRAPRGGPFPGAMPPHAYYAPPYAVGDDGAPLMYMVDPNSGMSYSYPVYYPGMMPPPYMGEVPIQPYYPSAAAPAATTVAAASVPVSVSTAAESASSTKTETAAASAVQAAS